MGRNQPRPRDRRHQSAGGRVEPASLCECRHQATLTSSRYTRNRTVSHYFPCNSSVPCWTPRDTQRNGQGVSSGPEAHRPPGEGSHLEDGWGSGIISHIPVVISCGGFLFFLSSPATTPDFTHFSFLFIIFTQKAL